MSRKFIPLRERETVDINTACDMIGLSRAFLYKMMDEGRLEYLQVGRKRLLKVPSLLALIGAPISEAAA